MYVDIWCTVSVCLCELCLFMKNVCNFELIKINKIQKKRKKESDVRHEMCICAWTVTATVSHFSTSNKNYLSL